MLRLAFNIGSAVSLLLCIVTVVLWVRSYWRLDLVGYEGEIRADQSQWGGNGSSACGLFACEVWRRWNPRATPTAASAFEHSSRSVPTGLSATRGKYAETLGGFHVMGFGFARHQTNPEGGRALNPGAPAPATPARQAVWSVAIPYWQVAIGLALVPAAWFIRSDSRRRARRRQPRCLCTNCGYNLTANASGVCPECGAAVTNE